MLLLLCSFILLSFENPIYSIFFLVLVFFVASFLLIELGLFFSSLMILIIYLGALIVLFLFVVMMLNIKALELNRVINFFPSIFIFFSSYLVLIMTFDFDFSFLNAHFEFLSVFFFDSWYSLYFYTTSFLNLGFVLYSFYLHLLIIISLILLTAMLGAIVLTLNFFRQTIKQNNRDQILQYKNLLL